MSKTKRKTAPSKSPRASLTYRVGGWPTLEIFTPGEAAQARKAVAKLYGTAFSSKATDRLCAALAQGRRLTSPRAIILEMSRPAEDRDAVTERVKTLIGRRARIPHLLLQFVRRQLCSDRFSMHVAEMTSELDRRAELAAPARKKSAVPTHSHGVAGSCWLNGAIRTYLDAKHLREIASHEKLLRLDLPRRLQRAINVSVPSVGAPQFRTKFGISGEHVTVAVIDSEIDNSAQQPALQPRVVQKANFTNESWGNPDVHGTAVAGIIASMDGGHTGVGPGLTITNYKVLTTDPRIASTDHDGALAIMQALHDGAQVANCSWDTGPAGDGTSREAEACNTAWNQGLVIVTSVGNRGTSPPTPGTVNTPADADGVIAVGATDRRGTTVQDYSSRGPVGAKSRPHLVAPGGTEDDPLVSCGIGGDFPHVGAGTSFAAPHVSGLAALLIAQTPGMTPNQVRNKLISLCAPIPGGGDQNSQGAGFISVASL